MPAYEVGKRYRVPTIWPKKLDKGRSLPWPVPVLLPLHGDAEIIKFPYEHFHVDLRFMADRQLRHYYPSRSLPRRSFADLLGFPISLRLSPSSSEGVGLGRTGALMIVPAPKVIWRWRICRRLMPSWEATYAVMDKGCLIWQQELEAAYGGAHIQKDSQGRLRCPHKYICLEGLAELGEERVVECPGHGLRWSLRDGTLVAWAKDDVKGDGPA